MASNKKRKSLDDFNFSVKRGTGPSKYELLCNYLLSNNYYRTYWLFIAGNEIRLNIFLLFSYAYIFYVLLLLLLIISLLLLLLQLVLIVLILH